MGNELKCMYNIIIKIKHIMINDTNSHMIVNIYKLKTTVNKQQFK